MTGAEFLAYVKRKFKRTDKDTEIYEATTDVIADIRLQLRTEDYKEEAYTADISVLGDYRVSLPTDFGHLIGDITLIDDTGSMNRKLKKMSKQSYDDKYPERLHTDVSNVDLGVPVDYCIYSGQVYLGPVPDDITYKYYMNYTTEDYAATTALTDPVPYSERYRQMLRYGVLADLYDGLDFIEEAQIQQQKYMSELLKLKVNDDENIDDKDLVKYHGI